MVDSSSVMFEMTEFVNKCIQNGELTKDNCTNKEITSKLLTKFMDGKNLQRPKVRPIWYEIVKKSMLDNFNVSIDESTINEQKIGSYTEKAKDEIKQQIKNVMMSYNGNWVIDSFGTNRKEKIVKFISFKFNLDEIESRKLYNEILHDLAEMDVKPYGQ